MKYSDRGGGRIFGDRSRLWYSWAFVLIRWSDESPKNLKSLWIFLHNSRGMVGPVAVYLLALLSSATVTDAAVFLHYKPMNLSANSLALSRTIRDVSRALCAASCSAAKNPSCNSYRFKHYNVPGIMYWVYLFLLQSKLKGMAAHQSQGCACLASTSPILDQSSGQGPSPPFYV